MKKILIFLGALVMSSPITASEQEDQIEVCKYYATNLYDMNLGGASYEAILQYITSQQMVFIQGGKDYWALNELMWEFYSYTGSTMRMGLNPNNHTALSILEDDICPRIYRNFPSSLNR